MEIFIIQKLSDVFILKGRKSRLNCKYGHVSSAKIDTFLFFVSKDHGNFSLTNRRDIWFIRMDIAFNVCKTHINIQEKYSYNIDKIRWRESGPVTPDN